MRNAGLQESAKAAILVTARNLVTVRNSRTEFFSPQERLPLRPLQSVLIITLNYSHSCIHL